MLDQAKQDGDDTAGAPGVSMHTDTAMDYIDQQSRLFRGGPCYTTVPAINVVAEKHYAWALPIAAGIATNRERRPVGLSRLRQRRLQVAAVRPRPVDGVRAPAGLGRRVHVHVDPRGEPLPRPGAPARLDRCDPQRRRHAALLRRLHVGVQLDGCADDVLAHGARLLDPRPGEHRPRARGVLPQVGRPGPLRGRRGVRLARRHPGRRCCRRTRRGCARRRSTGRRRPRRRSPASTSSTRRSPRRRRSASAAAYRDIALGLPAGTTELEKGTKKEGASACQSAKR